MSVTHVLDTSALLAHYFDEPGADVVQRIWASRGPKPGISVVTVAELRGRLDQEITDTSERESAAEAYLGDLTVCLPVDRAVAELAWHIRIATPQRLPLVDALIAATARAAGAILVHKDPPHGHDPRGVGAADCPVGIRTERLEGAGGMEAWTASRHLVPNP